jgi:hypothetical protein
MTSGSMSPSKDDSVPTGAITGGVVGGIIGLLLIALAFWFGMHRGKAGIVRGQPVPDQEAFSRPLSPPAGINPNITHRHPLNGGMLVGGPQFTTMVSGHEAIPQPLPQAPLYLPSDGSMSPVPTYVS